MKTVVVTGATSGIGNLIAKEFAKKGYKVFAGYRNITLKKELVKISENVIPFYIDMSKKWSIADAAKFICEQTDKIDALVNAAGCVVAGPMECLNVDKIREQFEINTFAQLEFTQGIFEKLGVNGVGRIINISSEASYGIFPFVAPYCASKRALDILFNTMQIECWQDIKVISIKPGVIKTPLWEKSIEANKEVLGDVEKYQKEMDFMIKNAERNAKKGLNPQKVADLVLKVEATEKPKSSYVIGFDAKIAEVISHLPQDWINWLARKMLEKRCIF